MATGTTLGVTDGRLGDRHGTIANLGNAPGELDAALALNPP